MSATGHDAWLLYLALAFGAGAALLTAWLFSEVKRRTDDGDIQSRSIDQLKAEVASLKREHVQLNETVSRFRAQSLAGISETISETINSRETELGLAIKDSMEARMRTDLGALSKEFDLAMEATIERLGRLERVGPRDETYDPRADLQTLSRRLDLLDANAGRTNDLAKNFSEINKTMVDLTKNAKMLSAGQVIDRFLSSLEEPEERLKCLLASFDSISDSATLGKLAVAYPNKNSWIILKELSEHGVVSEVAAWAMIAGARLSVAAGDTKMALHLFLGARHSFITCGGNQDGLWVVNAALVKLTEGEVSEGYAKDAMANIFALKSNIAQSNAPLQLADFYQRDDRIEIAATLLTAVSELYLELDSLAYQACLRVVENLGQILLTQYQNKNKNLGGENTFAFLIGSLSSLKALHQRCQNLSREARAGLLLSMMLVARSARDGDAAIFAAGPLLELSQPHQPGSAETTADNFAGKIFTLAPAIFESILLTLDSLELSRKRRSMQLLERLTAAFLDINSLTRASSCGAKLVDCALETYGDGAAETVEPISILASIYRRMQRLDLVEECFRQILEIQYKVYSSESEEITETMLNLSDICRLQNDLGQAEIFLDSAIETGEELMRKDKSSAKLVTLLNRARTIRGVEPKVDELPPYVPSTSTPLYNSSPPRPDSQNTEAEADSEERANSDLLEPEENEPVAVGQEQHA